MSSQSVDRLLGTHYSKLIPKCGIWYTFTHKYVSNTLCTYVRNSNIFPFRFIPIIYHIGFTIIRLWTLHWIEAACTTMGKTSQKRNIFKNGSLAFEGRGVKGYIYIGEVYLLPKCRIQKCKNQKCNFFLFNKSRK